MSETTRRSVLAGAAGASAAVVLAACSDGDSGSDDTGAKNDTGTNGASSAPPAAAGSAIKAADIPVGGGKVYADSGYVVTQPAAGDFKAFSAVCPHQGCKVNSVANGQIVCPCHKSFFSAKDGSVMSGPSPKGLAAKTVTVTGDNLTVA